MQIALLGSTGSIGTNTLLIAEKFDIKVEVLAAGSNTKLLQKQIEQFRPKMVVVKSREIAKQINHKKVFWGEKGIIEALCLSDSKKVVNALAGFVGLNPTIEALKNKKEVILANKESLVLAGKFLDTSKIIPIDSEHFGLWYILKNCKNSISKLIITASGGAFRDWEIEKISSATKNEALKHPNWKMGKKITIDSATMVNKLFEILEAKWIFKTVNIDALIETKSLVHAIVNFADGSSLLHAAVADMRLPIAFALKPKLKKETILPQIDFSQIGNLEFRKISDKRYPVWSIKNELLQNPDLGIVLSAANEKAQKLFLKGKIDFGGISKLILYAIDKYQHISISSIKEIFLLHREIERFVEERFREIVA
jgi:1-deoxy-D-xylulose-5-phosphate reductoisomerase